MARTPNYRKYPLQPGGLLLAEPFAYDKTFKRAAILICDHHQEDGSVGFIINKPLKMPASSVVKGIPDFDGEIFFGGPVHTDTLHYLHTKGDLIEGSIPVKDGLFWGGDFEQVRFCINNELISKDDIRFMVGYSGWTAGQLEEEINAGYWWLVEHHPQYLFKTAHEEIWKVALAEEEDTLSVIAQMPEQIMN